jgi:hypothetical protein
MNSDQLTLGPLLGIEDEASYTICFVTPSNTRSARVIVNGRAHSADKIANLYSGQFWRTNIELPVPENGLSISYTIEIDSQQAKNKQGLAKWHFYQPGRNENARLAYASCNGFSDLKLMNSTERPNALWDELLTLHDRKPFSALLMGGDQVYADSIWTMLPSLREWNSLPLKEKIKRKTTKTMLEQLDRFYSTLYCERWAKEPVAVALASIPTVMMWDDHDIVDGWGSFPAELQECDVFQAIYKAAAKHFEVFQLRGHEHNKSRICQPGTAAHYSTGFHFRGNTVLAMDHRSERTIHQVMSPQHWADINAFLDTVKQGNLLLLSAVPVVYRDFSFVESAFDATPWEEELSDDLKDHWRAREHQGERARLIMRLLSNAYNRMGHTVILSGDVHVGCLGVVTDKSQARLVNIHQVVSSGIVHPAPTHIQWMGILATTNDRKEQLDENGNICAEMLKPFGAGTYFRTRNFVTLEKGSDQKLWVNWICENGEKPVYPLN